MMTRCYEEANRIAKIIGREIATVESVECWDGVRDFAITHKYEDMIRRKGYSLGSMERGQPRAICDDGSQCVPKWRNLHIKEFSIIDGFVICDDNRNGVVATIVMLRAMK